jgi:23S rRNA (pseudouridine1915-N3)-methyltransferase
VRIFIIAAANRQPPWVESGYGEYAKRFRGNLRLELKEVALAPRGAGTDACRAIRDEGRRMMAHVPRGAHVVALEERGETWSTQRLAVEFERWMAARGPVCLLIGGPDGLSAECVAAAHARWSLSPLTLPHGIVRILVAEALYRAWSVIEGHPYHRAG